MKVSTMYILFMHVLNSSGFSWISWNFICIVKWNHIKKKYPWMIIILFLFFYCLALINTHTPLPRSLTISPEASVCFCGERGASPLCYQWANWQKSIVKNFVSKHYQKKKKACKIIKIDLLMLNLQDFGFY